MTMEPESTRRRVARAAATWLVVAGARLAVALLPWRLVARLADRAASVRTGQTSQPAWRVAARTVRLSAYVPGASCLTQALAARVLLAWHGHASDVRFGVRRDGSVLVAHAWLEHRGQVLVGGPDVAQYATLAAPTAHHAR